MYYNSCRRNRVWRGMEMLGIVFIVIWGGGFPGCLGEDDIIDDDYDWEQQDRQRPSTAPPGPPVQRDQPVLDMFRNQQLTKIGQCYSCTERTNAACFRGEGGMKSSDCTLQKHGKMECIKLRCCASGLDCIMFRGCLNEILTYCLEVAGAQLLENSCGKKRFKVNSPLGSTSSLCLRNLKNLYELGVEDVKNRQLQEKEDEKIKLKATSPDEIEVELQYCLCSSDDCNHAVGRGGEGMGMIMFATMLAGRMLIALMN